ncbi:MAG: DUF98 domain-containing protein [Methanomicrobiaceae archaeon]|nr:DUF98 domain-containing protein [Methanomicrobiaceae archaeon]
MDINIKFKAIENQLGHLSSLQKILLGTDGSVTRILEIATDSQVGISTKLQEIISADKKIAEELQIKEGDPVNYRIVELKNNNSPDVLIYAVSYTPVDRLDPKVKSDFMKADIPIGKIIQNHQIESRRQIIDAEVIAADANMSRTFGIFKGEPLLSRHYNIIHQKRPIININEIFPYNSFSDEKKVIVKAPSRIHLGLLDMNGGIGRVDGGIGISLKEPCVLIEACQDNHLIVSGTEKDSRDIVRNVAGHVIKEMDIQGAASITIRKSPQRHVGLGSGTSLSLATAKALLNLNGIESNARELARLTGRGGTSGIGTAAFEHGGFIVDGGHSFGNSCDKSDFRPSSASRGLIPAPVTAKMKFPEEWKILIAIPDIAPGASGDKEVQIFRDYCPVPLNEVREICHEVLMRMLPGIAGADLDLFGSSVNKIQELGFKKIELAQQPQLIHDLLNLMRETGAVCSGMSSFGPALYAIGDCGMKNIEHAVFKYLEEQNKTGNIFLTSASNTGAQIRG